MTRRVPDEDSVVVGANEGGVIEDDAALLRATRAGDTRSYGHLYERHAGAALVVARQYTDSSADAEDVVSDSFANVHRALMGGGGPESAFRAYLFTVVRRVAAVHRTAGRRAEPTDDVATLETASTPVETAEAPTLAGFERGVVARAFRSLPERWREVLWHSEVEGLTPAQIAPIVGLSANSTAALAYRAREGLRQAYLQQHLQDPLDDGCRSVAGKLGAHVRGGLGARDTRQVEQHLDECGDCRALVLELGDVNHGMRAVVAPLVLGLLGLGALAHELPVGGGIVAGALALGQSGGAVGAAGSGAGGAGASGSGASGAGASGGTAGGGGAGAGGAAASGTGVAGGGAAAVTGAAGVLAGVSASAVAVVVAAVVVVTVAIVGAVQLLSGPDDGVAEPTSDVAGASQTASPSSQPDASQSPRSTPTVAPPPGASPQPTDEAVAAPGATPRPRGASAPGTGAPAGPQPDPTTAPTTAPTPAPTTAPTPDPSPEPAPADVVVAAPAGGIALTAGAGGQPLALTVSNAGGLPAAGLVADVELPVGVTLENAPVAALTGFGFAPAAPAVWQCVTSADARSATCTLDELPPGQDAVLELRVGVDESFQASGQETVRVRIAGGGRTWQPAPIRVAVASSPARLAFGDGVPADVQLVTGRSRALVVPVRNAGGSTVTPASPAVVEVTLPPGVTATAGAPWVCSGLDGPALTCRHDALPAFAHAPLSLTLRGDPAAATGTGTMHVRLTPSAYRPVETRDLPYALVRPASLALEAPAALDVAPGTEAALPVTVAAGGDLAAPGTTLTLTAPNGAAVTDVDGPGWACTLGDGDAVCVSDLPAGARSEVVARLIAPVGTAGALGDVTATVTAVDADVPAAPTAVPLTALEPVVSLTDAAAVVDEQGGTVAFVAHVAAVRDDGRPGAAAADVRAVVTLPPGVTADPDSAGPQTSGCTSAGAVVTCALGDLRAGADVPVQLNVRAAGAVRGTVQIRLTARAAQPAATSAQVVVASANLTPVWSGVGDLQVTEVGAPLLGCVDLYGATCTAVTRERDNNGLDMRPLDLAAPDGPRADVPVSSRTRLDVPDERPVVWAGLYWSAVRGPGDGWSGALDTARLRAPDGAWTDVTGASLTQVADNGGRQYYQAAVDVTDIVARGGGGDWALADVAVSKDRTDRNPSYYAGWSLVVVHGTQAEAGTPRASTVTVHQGGAWIGTAASAPAFVFVGEAGARTRIGVVAWEGDRGTTGDQLTLSGVGALTPQRWNGTAVVGGGSSSNAFDSTATGWMYPNSLGVDAKGFAEVPLPSGVGTLTPSTAGDQYLIGVVTVRTSPPQSLTTPRSVTTGSS